MTGLEDSKAVLSQEPLQDLETKMVVMARDIEMKPVSSCEAGLKTRVVRNGHEEESVRLEKGMRLSKGGNVISDVLEDMPDHDGVERGVLKRAVLDRTDVDRHSKSFSGVLRSPTRDLDAMGVPASLAQDGRQVSAPAANVQHATAGGEPLDQIRPPSSKPWNEAFESSGEAPVPRPVVGRGIKARYF